MSESQRCEEDLFDEARKLTDLRARALFLEGACGGDRALRLRLEQLLAALSDSDEYFGPFAAQHPGPAMNDTVGTSIGRYKLLEKIGEGGFGVVYVAQQSEPVKRSVALKIIKLGMDTAQVVARFEAERQALALMDHPGIAKVFDGGATGMGRPYFVMELVRGVPITSYCDEHHLSSTQRLELFIQVCQAVQHAHQKGVIHRDLKPSNILVTSNDAVAVPKIIDFGIAKAIQQELTEKTIVTQSHHFLGTPAYMSPEQAELTSADIDTRSDIYSLGVLLYELLTGKTPFDGKELLAAGLDEMRRTIREKEPQRPSTRLKERGGARSEPLTRDFRIVSDLDWIVMKCLEKDRARRYESATELATDIQRHLDHEPVQARPPSAAYRCGKFIRRHRTASIAAGLVALVVLAGIGFSTWSLMREREARLRERAALQQANQHLSAALGFVNQVLTKVAPEIRLVAGATKAQDKLLQAGLNFVHTLRANAGDNPAARVALVQLLIYMSERENPGEPNATGNYEVGLKRAEEAVELLRAETPQLTDTERLDLLFQAKSAMLQCLYGLSRWDEGLARAKQIEPLLDRLEKIPARAQWATRERMLLLGNAGWANFEAGRTNEALECALSLLGSGWARGVTNKLATAGWGRIHLIMNAHDVAGNVYGLLLKDFDAMRPHADEAARIGELLMRQDPKNPFFVYLAAQNRAWRGYALMRTGNIAAGLADLNQARQALEERADKESDSEAFRNNRRIIAALQALAFCSWSEDRTAPLEERRQRMAKAEEYLAEAEEFSRAVKVQSRTMETARTEVPAARTKLEAEERTLR